MYSTNPATYVKGTLITPNNPSNTGGAITSYTVVGTALPAGLNLNASTGVITGTPTAVTADGQLHHPGKQRHRQHPGDASASP